MFQLIYVSAPRIALSQDVLREIAEESRERNARLGVAGVLMMAENVVMQVLEGEETAVRELYAKIARDKRHKDCEILVARSSQERQFGPWHMGFCETGTSDSNALLEVINTLRVNRAIHVAAQRIAS